MPTKRELAKLKSAVRKINKIKAQRETNGESMAVGSLPPPDLTKCPRTREEFARALEYTREDSHRRGVYAGLREAEENAKAKAERQPGLDREVAKAWIHSAGKLAESNALLAESVTKVLLALTGTRF